jgi:hypothetical protein
MSGKRMNNCIVRNVDSVKSALAFVKSLGHTLKTLGILLGKYLKECKST